MKVLEEEGRKKWGAVFSLINELRIQSKSSSQPWQECTVWKSQVIDREQDLVSMSWGQRVSSSHWFLEVTFGLCKWWKLETVPAEASQMLKRMVGKFHLPGNWDFSLYISWVFFICLWIIIVSLLHEAAEFCLVCHIL